MKQDDGPSFYADQPIEPIDQISACRSVQSTNESDVVLGESRDTAKLVGGWWELGSDVTGSTSRDLRHFITPFR